MELINKIYSDFIEMVCMLKKNEGKGCFSKNDVVYF
jgi:hypothetical protein